MPNIPIKNCTGCTACYSVCPASAIRMTFDVEGFAYPYVDADKCTECGACERACPIITPPTLPDAFETSAVARSKDREVLSECTSGGFLDEACRYVTEELGGYAVGVAYDAEHMPYHKICASYAEAKTLRNSKYAQSELGEVFGEIKKLLSEDKTVLFIGTPCQCAGLVSYIGNKNAKRLMCADLVCRSIPSRMLWREYLSYQKEKHGSKIKSVACRKKTYGYHSGALEIEFENGKKYAGSNRVDPYMKAFHADVCSRRSCYACAFKTEHRCTDLTVFDCWDPERVTGGAAKDDDLGYSSVIAHTPRGAELLRSIERIETYDAPAAKLLALTGKMATESIRTPEGRARFYSDVAEQGYLQGVKKHIVISAKDKLIEAAKPLRYKLKKAFGKHK